MFRQFPPVLNEAILLHLYESSLIASQKPNPWERGLILELEAEFILLHRPLSKNLEDRFERGMLFPFREPFTKPIPEKTNVGGTEFCDWAELN
jgi:hypothetical protein